MRKTLLALVLTACPQPAPSTPPASMPWLKDFPVVTSSDMLAASVLERMDPPRDCDEPCPDYGGIEVRADVAPHPGIETIRASFTRGVVVVGEDTRVLARRPAFEAMGSADELVALAIVDARLATPVIAIAVRTGGRREHTVRLELVRVEEKLVTLFSGVVEEHDGEGDALGSVALVPDGIIYLAPRASAADHRSLR